MTLRIDVGGVRTRVVDPDLGSGGQGKAMLVELEDLPGTRMVLKGAACQARDLGADQMAL